MAAFDNQSFDTGAFSVGAFDFGAGPTPPAPDAGPQPIVGGGFTGHGTLRLRRRDGRSKEELEEDRKRFGILPAVAEVVAEVAERQADRLEQDEHKRFEELSRELELRGLEWDARYLEALNVQRERLIDEEISSYMAQVAKQNDDIRVILMLLGAAV